VVPRGGQAGPPLVDLDQAGLQQFQAVEETQNLGPGAQRGLGRRQLVEAAGRLGHLLGWMSRAGWDSASQLPWGTAV
jgi:hypothetical protein